MFSLSKIFLEHSPSKNVSLDNSDTDDECSLLPTAFSQIPSLLQDINFADEQQRANRNAVSTNASQPQMFSVPQVKSQHTVTNQSKVINSSPKVQQQICAENPNKPNSRSYNNDTVHEDIAINSNGTGSKSTVGSNCKEVVQKSIEEQQSSVEPLPIGDSSLNDSANAFPVDESSINDVFTNKAANNSRKVTSSPIDQAALNDTDKPVLRMKAGASLVSHSLIDTSKNIAKLSSVGSKTVDSVDVSDAASNVASKSSCLSPVKLIAIEQVDDDDVFVKGCLDSQGTQMSGKKDCAQRNENLRQSPSRENVNSLTTTSIANGNIQTEIVGDSKVCCVAVCKMDLNEEHHVDHNPKNDILEEKISLTTDVNVTENFDKQKEDEEKFSNQMDKHLKETGCQCTDAGIVEKDAKVVNMSKSNTKGELESECMKSQAVATDRIASQTGTEFFEKTVDPNLNLRLATLPSATGDIKTVDGKKDGLADLSIYNLVLPDSCISIGESDDDIFLASNCESDDDNRNYACGETQPFCDQRVTPKPPFLPLPPTSNDLCSSTPVKSFSSSPDTANKQTNAFTDVSNSPNMLIPSQLHLPVLRPKRRGRGQNSKFDKLYDVTQPKKARSRSIREPNVAKHKKSKNVELDEPKKIPEKTSPVVLRGTHRRKSQQTEKDQVKNEPSPIIQLTTEAVMTKPKNGRNRMKKETKPPLCTTSQFVKEQCQSLGFRRSKRLNISNNAKSSCEQETKPQNPDANNSASTKSNR